MQGPDSKLQVCHPVLFSVAMDYPEACLFTQVRSGTECPVCDVTKDNFDDLSQSFEFRDPCSLSNTISKVMQCDEDSIEIDPRKIELVDKKVSEKSILETDVNV